ncbi:serine-threonine protein kinase, putative [Bodo saltans]|uniref:non-specific serine/threonine protein kinase n=1 Tax=Bodo saltans TaxID=75058 RepID=A0A0S4J4B3_BODSA|nr:serine-threonine protein kinase, putative [Bodo saltans]|eukprot:CUG82099.1 serine-threonine protein kinase, putative [Bodo saltans]
MGKKIGKYELGKTLGTGNFSKVKVGTDAETGETWAIKIIDKEQLAKERMEEQLKREIAVMKMLKQANIVQLKEVMQTANHIYLVLELVTGGELFDKIVAAKRFDEPTARKYFHQLISGIHYCHSQGIAHRDLKPENLLLDANDTLKISDFGLSNLQRGGADGQGTLLQTVCGTPNYVAPEVLKERGYNGITADVWSCGVVLFVMLAGFLPFDDPNMNALFNKIERGEYRMARHFSDQAKDLIAKMMTVDPTKRITIQGIVDHPWFQVGFDAKLLKLPASGKLQVSDDQVRNAITDADEQKKSAPKNEAAPSNAPAPKAGVSGGCDAFDLISRLTSGTLNPLITVQQGMVRSSTRFLIHGDIKDVLQVLSSLNANPKSKEGSLEIKGFLNAPKGLLTYLAVLIPTCASKLTLVELRRGRGDVFEFHDLFRQVVAGLGSKVRSKEAPQA